MKARRPDQAQSNEDLEQDAEVAPPEVTRGAMAAWSAAQAGDAIAPVQAHADRHRDAMTDWSAAEGAAAATRSVEDASEPLPHRAPIQAAFGDHDVSGIRAKTGGAAGEAAAAIGATAFATGDRVGFAGSPDLHTAAHEAAHVVQQRQGVVAYAGLGARGDVHEQHADRVADAVVAGRSAAPILGEIVPGGGVATGGFVQRDEGKVAPTTGSAVTTALGLFDKASSAPPALVTVTLLAARLPPELAALLAVDPQVSVSVQLSLVNGQLGVVVVAGAEVLIAKVDLQQVLAILAGPAGAQIADLLPKAEAFAASAAGRFTAVGGSTHVKIHLWGDAQDASFVVIDLAAALRGATHNSLSGLRPVEARLATKFGRVEQFAGDQIKAATALPPAADALGTLEVASPSLRKDVLGLDDAAPVHATVYYRKGKLAIAITDQADATSGVVAEIDLAHLVGRLRALGEKVGSLLEGLLAKLKGDGRDFLDWTSGLLRFDLGGGFGNFFGFDFHMLLPRLGGGGGGFNLGALWPTTWSFSLPGLQIGALPKLSVPWLAWPKLDSFGVDVSRLGGLFSGLGLPALPSLPRVNFDLHFSKLELGLALDLGKLWPDLDWGEGGPSTFGLTLDLGALLEVAARVGGAIGKAGRALLDKLRKAGDSLRRWVHPGGDGLIRIFDGDARDPGKTSMLGFSLLRLLDGVQVTDLVPTEIRYHGDDAQLELGQAVPEGADADATAQAREAGATTPRRPATPLAEQDELTLPASALSTLGLAAGAKGYVSVSGGYPDLIVYAQAKSGHRDGDEALRLSVNIAPLVDGLVQRFPASRRGKTPKPHLGGIKIGDDAALEISIGEKAADGEPPVPYARAAWRISKLLGASDLTALIPDRGGVEGPGIGVTLGPFERPEGLLGKRFPISAPGVRKDVLGVPDGNDDVYLGVYYADHELALTATPDANKDEGLLGHVNVIKLLEQLKRLGGLGEKILDGIGKVLGAGLGKAKDFAAKAAAIAAKIGRGFLDLVGSVLRLKLPELPDGSGGGWIGWDLSRLAPNISLSGFSLDGIIPDFEGLKLPGMPGLSLSWLPKMPFSGDFLDSVPFPSVDLKKLFGGMGIDLPSLPDFNFDIFSLDNLGLGISIDLSFLDGVLGDLFSGDHKLSFQIDLAAILRPFDRAWQWLQSKFPKGRAKRDSNTHVKLGTDGVLRLWDEHAHIGFALKNLLDGFQPSDVVPVEMQFHVTAGGTDTKPGTDIASLEYGRVVDKDHKAPAKLQEGQVLAQRPGTKVFASAKFDAPEVVRKHLGAPAGADLDVDLMQDGDNAVLFATVTGSDRGMVLRLNSGKLSDLVDRLGPKAPRDLDGGIKILWDKCRAAHGLVIGFGHQPDAKTKPQQVKPHGHAMWRLSRFFDGLELGDLVPDEAHIEIAEGAVSVGVGLDVSGLPEVGTIDVPEHPTWLRSGLGSKRAAVHANADENKLRVALVAAPDGDDVAVDPKAPKRGLELDVATWFVDKIEDTVAKMAKTAGETIGKALKKVAGAGKRAGGDLTDKRISLKRTAAGLRLQRGTDGDADHLYATFGWSNLVDAVTTGNLAGLVPVELRLATSAVALEIEEAELPQDPKMPADAKRIGGMHALFRDALGAFGLAPSQFLELKLGESPIVPLPDGGHNVNLVGMIYTPETEPPATDRAPGIAVSHASKVTLSISLEALLAQVLPRKRAFANQKKHKKAKDGGTSMSLGFHKDLVPEEKGDQAGIELGLISSHTSKKSGHTSTVEVHAGWTAEQLIEILMNLDDIVDDNGLPTGTTMGLLTPDVLRGSFANHLFKMELANRGEAVGHSIRVGDLPILPDIMSTFLDVKTANETRLHVEVPGATELASSFGKALLAGQYVPLGRAAIEIPGAEHLYSATLSMSLGFLEKLAGFIPYVGLAIKIIRGVESFVKDPKGTAEAILYTPELLYHFVDNAGAIYDKLKGMSAKDLALAFMSNDSTTKQAVYAARLKKRMEKAGIKLPDGAAGGEMPSEAELAWLNKQDPKAIEKAMQVEARLAELGIYPEEEKPDPKGTLNMKDLVTFEEAIQAGFTEFAKVRENAEQHPDDPAAQQAVAVAAEKFRKEVAARIAAGAKKLERDVERDEVDEKDLPAGAPAPDIEGDPTYLKDLPQPDADQIARAQEMFKQTKDGLDPTYESYLIQKYAFLTLDQLAEMLENGQVPINGKVLPMFEAERPFVMALFKKIADPTGTLFPKSDGTKPGATSAEMVTAWRNRGHKADSQSKKDAKKAAADAAKAAKDAKAKGGKGGKGGKGAGAGSGGDAAQEGEESLDDAMWSEEPGERDQSGYGDTGQGLDQDGDGELSADELKGKAKGEADKGTGEADKGKGDADKGTGDADKGTGDAGGGTEPVAEEPAKIDDHALWSFNRTLAEKWMIWDAASQSLKRNEEEIAFATGGKIQKETSTGEIATLTAVDITVLGDVGRGTKIIQYRITLIATTPTKEIRSYGQDFYYDVAGNETFEASGSGAIAVATRQTFEIKDDQAVLRGGKEFAIGTKKFAVTLIENTEKASDGYWIKVSLDVVEVPKNTKIRNAAGEWQVINDGDKVRMLLPYTVAATP